MSALIRRASFFAASLASSLARALMARASARRVARLLRRVNRPIPAASRSSCQNFAIVAAIVQPNTIVRASLLRGCGPAASISHPLANRGARLCDNLCTVERPAGDAMRGWEVGRVACANRRLSLPRGFWADCWWCRWRARLCRPRPGCRRRPAMGRPADLSRDRAVRSVTARGGRTAKDRRPNPGRPKINEGQKRPDRKPTDEKPPDRKPTDEKPPDRPDKPPPDQAADRQAVADKPPTDKLDQPDKPPPDKPPARRSHRPKTSCAVALPAAPSHPKNLRHPAVAVAAMVSSSRCRTVARTRHRTCCFRRRA